MRSLFVNGTLMRGLSLHHNLEGAEFAGEFRTAPRYRMHSISDMHPGMYQVGCGCENNAGENPGVSVTGELYYMADEVFQRVQAGEPPHLFVGTVLLENGRVVPGILYPRELAEKHKDISEFGDWRAYVATLSPHDDTLTQDYAQPKTEAAMNTTIKMLNAEPYDLPFEPARTALMLIDMQRDFMEPGGFGASLGNDVSLLRSSIEPAKRVLEAARKAGLMVIHTREGHAPSLADLPSTKKERGHLSTGIGDHGPMGRILVRGEKGHDIIPEVYPVAGEVVVDKPGKGAFWATDLLPILMNRGIKTLIVCGVTTEVCVNTTVREANDRGFECVVVSDATGSYFPEFQRVALEMIKAQGGIFGWVTKSDDVIKALA